MQVLAVSCPYNRGQLACIVLHYIGKFPRMSSQFSVPTTEDSWFCPPFHKKVSKQVLTVLCPSNRGQLACLVLNSIEKFPRMSSQFLFLQQRTVGLPCPPFHRKVSHNVSCPYNRGQLACLVLHSIGKFWSMSSQFPVPTTEDSWTALSSIP